MRLNYIDNCDCLEGLRGIPDGSVDLIVTDPPYGTMNTDGGRRMGINGWDIRIPAADLLPQFVRILRPNGKAVIFSQGEYTAELMVSALPALPFSYRAVWVKDKFANCLGVNKAMVSLYEDICIFSKIAPKRDFDGKNPLREYFRRVLEYTGAKSCKDINAVMGHRRSEHCFYIGSTQFALCTEPVYQELTERFRLDAWPDFQQYADLRAQEDAYRAGLIEQMNAKAPSVFNLWQGGKFKSNVLTYPKDRDGFHPTQKPLALIEDLVQTFSNPGDVVLDPFMGSGTTATAAIKTGRNYIGFELNPEYHAIALRRIADTVRADSSVQGRWGGLI